MSLLVPAAASAGREEGMEAFAAERYQDALREFSNAVGADRQDFHSWLMMGRSLEELGRLAEAVRFVETARQLRPKNARALTTLGRLFLEMGRPERALPVLDEAAGMVPEDRLLQINLARSLALLERPEEALQILDRVDPSGLAAVSQAGFHEARGSAKLQLGEPEAARRDFESALTFQPSRALYHHLLGTAARESGDLEKALGPLRRASLLDPESSRFRRAYEKAVAASTGG